MRFLLLALVVLAASGTEAAPLDEDFGYVTVREGAHMFWVTYHVDQPEDYTTYPLIMWLQGGPGASGVGYGNFQELGPYDMAGNPRPYAWTKSANLMFVDNPVGTGYSYVEDIGKLANNNTEIADDLVELVKSVFTDYPDYQVMPFFVFAESYGGKMTVDFALAFDKAIKNGEVVSDFRGVALGDSWISPMDSVNTWGTFLYQMGFANAAGRQEIDNAAAATQAEVDAGNWVQATNKWGDTEVVVMNVAHNVDFYNVLATDDIYLAKSKPHSRDLTYMSPEVRGLHERHVLRLHNHDTRDALNDFMNGPQADQWNIPANVEWDSQGGLVFTVLSGDFMKPVVDSVVRLLTETSLQVTVFTGDLDLICDTPGTYKWIEEMDWPDKPGFMAAPVSPIYITAYANHAATVQTFGRFNLYTILRSGHMVPIDAPEMGLKMVDMITAASMLSKQTGNKEDEKQKPEAPTKQEAPKQEKPKEEAPKQEEPKEEAPKQEEPEQEEPKQAAPEPKTEPKPETKPEPETEPVLKAEPKKNPANNPRSKVVATHFNPATPTGKRYAEKMGTSFRKHTGVVGHAPGKNRGPLAVAGIRQ